MNSLQQSLELIDELFASSSKEESTKELYSYIDDTLCCNEDLEMLERENKAMAEFLSSLGYTDEEVSNIANGSYLLNNIDK